MNIKESYKQLKESYGYHIHLFIDNHIIGEYDYLNREVEKIYICNYDDNNYRQCKRRKNEKED